MIDEELIRTGWLFEKKERRLESFLLIMLIISLPLIPAETNRRLQIFHENLKTAEKLQSLDQGSAEYGVTKFSDLTGACACVLAPFQMRICNFQFACLHRLPSKNILSFCFFNFFFFRGRISLHVPEPAPESVDSP